MKTWLALAISAFLLNSCEFEAPFESEAKIPVDAKLLGRWEGVDHHGFEHGDLILVLQNSANEYVVEWGGGDENAVFFRAFGVELEGEDYIQIQFIGRAKGAAEPKDRKYLLLKIRVDGDTMEMRTVNADLIGRGSKDSVGMNAAFKAHKDDKELFNEPLKFTRLK